MPSDAPLPLVVPPALLGGPFSTADARAAGVPQHRLAAMLRRGVLRRVLRGVYVDATLPDTAGLRAAALAVVLDPSAVAVDRTAAWVHGLDLSGDSPRVCDVLGSSRAGRHFGAGRCLGDHDVVRLPAGVRVTTPVRTVLDLGRLLPPARALATLDLALRTGRCTPRGLLAELPAQRSLAGAGRLPQLLVRADGRARDPGESVLRHCWWEAGLPVPVPGLVVADARLVLGLPEHRFAVVLTGAGTAPTPAAPGWTVLGIPAWRVRHGEVDLVADRLRAAFGAHLLGVHRAHDAGADALGRGMADRMSDLRHAAAAGHHRPRRDEP